jgi:hypothetical protein
MRKRPKSFKLAERYLSARLLGLSQAIWARMRRDCDATVISVRIDANNIQIFVCGLGPSQR